MLVKKFDKSKPFHVRDSKGNVYKLSEFIAYGNHSEDFKHVSIELYRQYRFLAPDLATVSLFKQSENIFIRLDNNETLKKVSG